MASPNTIKMNKSIPQPTPVLVKLGNPKPRTFRSRGCSYKDPSHVLGAFGNQPNKTIPIGYDGKFTNPKNTKA